MSAFRRPLRPHRPPHPVRATQTQLTIHIKIARNGPGHRHRTLQVPQSYQPFYLSPQRNACACQRAGQSVRGKTVLWAFERTADFAEERWNWCLGQRHKRSPFETDHPSQHDKYSEILIGPADKPDQTKRNIAVGSNLQPCQRHERYIVWPALVRSRHAGLHIN